MNQLFLTTQRSTKSIITVTRHRSKGRVQNLEFHQAQISTSQRETITVSDLFSLILPMLDHQQLQNHILVVTYLLGALLPKALEAA